MIPLADSLSGFGPFTPLRPLAGGHRNTVWLVAGAAGQAVAKSTRRTEAQLAWLAPLHAAARKAGFIVPAPFRTIEGCPVSNGWTLEPFVEGRPPGAADRPAIAPLIDRFHAGTKDIGQRPGFCSMAELCTMDHSGDIDLTALPLEMVQRLRQEWSALPDAPVQAIHGDLCNGNLILTAAGPALLDWDEARVDSSFLDRIGRGGWTMAEIRAHQALEIASCWHPEPELARALWNDLTLSGSGSPQVSSVPNLPPASA